MWQPKLHLQSPGCISQLPGLCDGEKLSAILLAAINVFQNRVQFPQELVVGELFLHGFRLQCLQLFNSCNEVTTFIAPSKDQNNNVKYLRRFLTYFISLLLFKHLFHSVGPVIERLWANLQPVKHPQQLVQGVSVPARSHTHTQTQDEKRLYLCKTHWRVARDESDTWGRVYQ